MSARTRGDEIDDDRAANRTKVEPDFGATTLSAGQSAPLSRERRGAASPGDGKPDSAAAGTGGVLGVFSGAPGAFHATTFHPAGFRVIVGGMRRPIMVAVGGDSGTGKVTLCKGLRDIFGEDRCIEVRLDGYFGLNRAQRHAVGITALDPRAHNFAQMEEDLWHLAQGRTIEKPMYDHRRGAVGRVETIEPREIVLVQGMFPLYTWALRSLFDVAVWLEPDADLKLAWTIHRDITERGYNEEQVRAELARRRPDYEKYIAPQARYADLRACFSRAGVTFYKSARLAPLEWSEIATDFTRMRRLEGDGGPFPRTVLEVDSGIDAASARFLEDAIWKRIGTRHATVRPERLGVFSDESGARSSPMLALTQLFVALRVCLVANELQDPPAPAVSTRG
jgi:phosphoribulokinase